MAARRTWVPIAVGVGILLVFVAVGGIYVAVSYVREQLQVEASTAEEADRAFAEVRRQFGDRAPLIEWREGKTVYGTGHERDAAPSSDRAPLEEFHVLAYNPKERKLARFRLPFWFLRLKSAPIEFSAYASGLDDGGVNLRPEDIERYGAGVIFDHTTPEGERVLFWAQ